jgi:hypothetical protein
MCKFSSQDFSVKFVVRFCAGTAPGSDCEIAGFSDPLAFRISDCEFGLRHIEVRRSCFVRLDLVGRMMSCFVIKPQKNRDQFSSDHLLSVIVTSKQIFSLEGSMAAMPYKRYKGQTLAHFENNQTPSQSY